MSCSIGSINYPRIIFTQHSVSPLSLHPVQFTQFTSVHFQLHLQPSTSPSSLHSVSPNTSCRHSDAVSTACVAVVLDKQSYVYLIFNGTQVDLAHCEWQTIHSPALCTAACQHIGHTTTSLSNNLTKRQFKKKNLPYCTLGIPCLFTTPTCNIWFPSAS